MEHSMGPGSLHAAAHIPWESEALKCTAWAALPASAFQEPGPAQAEIVGETAGGPQSGQEEALSYMPANRELQAQQSSGNKE